MDKMRRFDGPARSRPQDDEAALMAAVESFARLGKAITQAIDPDGTLALRARSRKLRQTYEQLRRETKS